MSATRLLILGVVRLKQPIHGYDVRRELELWHAEYWTSIAYGSIYFALRKLAEEGLIQDVGTDRVGRRPARTAYSITARGEEEYRRLLRDYWWEVRPMIDPFQVALTFMRDLPRDEILAALRHRATVARAIAESLRFSGAAKAQHGVPRHIEENLRLYAAHLEANVAWYQEALAKVERGELP